MPSASTEDVVDEVDRYLSNADVTVNSLLNYPRLATAFLKYNVPLPSSTAAERLVALGKYWSHSDVSCLTQCFKNLFSYIIS